MIMMDLEKVFIKVYSEKFLAKKLTLRMLIFIFCTRLVGNRLTFLGRNQTLTLTL